MMQLNSVVSLRPLALGYSVAVLSVGAATIGIPEMQARWHESAPVPTLLLAIALTAAVGGARPAMLAAVLSLVGLGYDLLTGSPFTEPVSLFRVLALAVLAGYVICLITRHEKALQSLRSADLEPCSNNEAPRTENIERRETEQQLADRLQVLSRRLFTVQEDERRHLARELHDEFGQVLVSIGMHLRAARQSAVVAHSSLDDSILLVQRATELLRRLVLELRLSMLDSDGFDAALQWPAEQFRGRTGMSVEVSGRIGELPDDMATACFRVVQEGLTNVARHARARRVWIVRTRSEESAELVVRDDGIGFSVATVLARAVRQGKLGLIGMAERAQLLGGELNIDAQPGHGTLIRLRIPVPKPDASSA